MYEVVGLALGNTRTKSSCEHMWSDKSSRDDCSYTDLMQHKWSIFQNLVGNEYEVGHHVDGKNPLRWGERRG